MCVGIGAAIGIIGTIASTAATMASAQAADDAAWADYQNKLDFRERQAEENQKTLNQQVANQQAALESEKNKAQGELAENAIKNMSVRGRLVAQGQEAGVDGYSLAHILASSAGEFGRFENRVRYNSAVGTQEALLSLQMAERGQQADLARIPIPQPPVSTAGIKTVGALGSAAGSIGGIFAQQAQYNARA